MIGVTYHMDQYTGVNAYGGPGYYGDMWNVIGHERAIGRLQQAMASNRLPHAVLFIGPAGVGKTHLAFELAKALNCVGEDPPCQRCLQCRQIEARSHPDIYLVERADAKDSIAIQQVRELRESTSLRPFQGRTKVYVFAGAEYLTPQAADALLKTLEEPQPQVQIVLTARDAESLPATVVSRCRVIPLPMVSIPAIGRALEDRGLEPETAERIARFAQGNVGWALRASKQARLVTQQEEMVSRLTEVLDMSLEARLQLAESLSADRKDRSNIRRSIELLVLLARDVLLESQGQPAQLVSGLQRSAIVNQAKRYSLTQIHAYIQGLRRAMERIDQNVDPRLALEALLVSLP